MRPNLSFENLTVVLAALGTSALVACAGATPQPVQASEVKPAANRPAGSASCSAKGCGASPATATESASMPSTAPAAVTPTSPATAAVPAATPAAAAVADTTTVPGTKTTTATVTTPAAVAMPKNQAARGSTAQAPKKKPNASGEASCGAGTCSGSATPKVR